jgi:hypothetical protein
MQIWTGDAARSELLIFEPKTWVRPQAAASAHRAHPVSSSRDQQPQTGRGPRPEVLDYWKSTVWLLGPVRLQGWCNYDSRPYFRGPPTPLKSSLEVQVIWDQLNEEQNLLWRFGRTYCSRIPVCDY